MSNLLRVSTAASSPLPAPAQEQARAKVNLTLRIKGKRPDGYHELESLVVFADVCDEVSFKPAASDSLHIEGPFAEALEGENLLLKAKRAVAARLGLEISGEFRLTKNIPVAAGLGGGSSDAAAAIRALLRAYGATGAGADGPALTSVAAAVGADVPVCLHHRAAWMRGLGERVTPVEGLRALPAVLVNPGVKLATRDVFKALNAAPYHGGGESGGAPFSTDWDSAESAAACLAEGRNDLEAPAAALQPAIADVLQDLRAQDGCLLARLSGSGPTCFGLFPTAEAAERARESMLRKRPSWWVAATTFS